MVSQTLAEDPASEKDPLKPFFLIKPEPETHVHTRHLFITLTNCPIIKLKFSLLTFNWSN